MRIILLGTGDFAVPALRALVAAGHEVTAAISQPDRPSGRGRTLAPTPVHGAADELGLPHIQAEDVNAPQVVSLFTAATAPPGPGAAQPEIAVVAAFGQKIGPEILSALPRGCINIHGSLLPKYRGAAPYQWAIINGEPVTGVTIFQLEQRWDAGPIWSQRETPIGETETADELHDRLAILGAVLLIETLTDIESGRAQPRPQDPTQSTRAPKLTKADAVLDWTQPAATIVRRIHGLWSWPAASCTFASRSGKRERVQLARARVTDADAAPEAPAPPGTFLADRTVQAGRGRVQLLEVKPAGGRLMPFDAFANGRQVGQSDRLLPPEPQ
jgi:methionyl-tRNA formyltransferase